MRKKRLIFSIVTYKTSLKEVLPLFNSINLFFKAYKNIYNLDIFICDNSPLSYLQEYQKLFSNLINIVYNHHPENPGFGAGHNLNILEYSQACNNDLILLTNPDIEFEKDQFKILIDFVFSNFATYSAIAPLLIDKNKNIQFSAKKNPTFLSLFLGRFSYFRALPIFQKYLDLNQNRNLNYKNTEIECPFLSGCFLCVPYWAFNKVKGFDESFFLHLEDADFVRRCSLIGKTVHFPKSIFIHRWARGSHKSIKQMLHVFISYVKYTLKWGFKFF